MTEDYAQFFQPILRGMFLIIALCSFIPFLGGLLFGVYGGWWGAAATVFILASGALMAMITKRKTTPLKAEDEAMATQLLLPDWFLIVYCATIGLGLNWGCAFLWFS